MSKPELLSPAGSLEAFFAAMENGADAVYCGLHDFSARAKAKNFTLTDLERMLNYAHVRGRKIYVTLNTLVKERELPQLAETLADLEALQVDAVILQDPAIWRLAQRHFPGLALHASTQMTVHNAAGIRQLERMGFSRAVLARELTLVEIAEIRRQTRLELEHFIHGALCFSFSGQCYFSSWLGGKSGNRGRCAQPCRRRYRHHQQDGYYFSPNDLSAIDLLPQLTEAGVCSFKIEGRMKSAEYVAAVVGAYRQVLDAPAKARKEAIGNAKERLKLSFGRLPTRGFLAGPNPTDIAVASVKGATGRFLGEITGIRNGAIVFKTRDRLHLGDRLRVQPKTDKAGTAFTVKTLQLGSRKVKQAVAESVVSVPSPFGDRFRKGDAVFKVSSEQAFTMSDAACRRRLDRTEPCPQKIDMTVNMEENELHLHAESGAISLERTYNVESFPADNKPLSADILREVFSRSAQEPITLGQLSVGNLPPVVIPPRRLKEIRRDFYRELSSVLERQRQEIRRQHLENALNDLLPASSHGAGAPRLTAAVNDLRDSRLLNDPAVDRLLVPLNPRKGREVALAAKRLRSQKERVAWDVPFILLEEDWQRARQMVRELAEIGFRTFRLNNIGHFELFAGLSDVELIAGYRLFSMNTQAILAWRDFGIREVTLYIEDDRENLSELLRRDIGVAATTVVYAQVPLITSRIRLKAVRSDRPVVSDRGERYRVSQRHGLTTLTSETDFSLIGRLADLQQLGARNFLVELGHCGPFSPRGKQVLAAFRNDRSLPDTSPFNFEMGME